MEPANPPLPTPTYRPVQLVDAGSQTSNSMCESWVGAITPCTRQNAGRDLNRAPATPAGGVTAPASMACVLVMVVAGSFSVFRFSQVAPATRPVETSADRTIRFR